MNDQAKKELITISELGSYIDVKVALENWWDKWIMEVRSEERVINVKYLSSEYKDALLERLALNCVDEVANDCVEYDLTSSKISAKFLCIKRGKNEPTARK